MYYEEYNDPIHKAIDLWKESHTVVVTVEAILVAQNRLLVKPKQPYIELAKIFKAN